MKKISPVSPLPSPRGGASLILPALFVLLLFAAWGSGRAAEPAQAAPAGAAGTEKILQSAEGRKPSAESTPEEEGGMACPHRSRQGRGPEGRGRGGMGPGPMGRGRQDAHHQTIQSLLDAHESIERRVEEVPGGVETWTESDDPEVAAYIRTHVRQMKERLTDGRPMRRWDPLFAAIFEHYEAVSMVIEDTPRGVHVIETSDDPEVTALIRQHAHRAVSEFVERGRARAHELTPLPEGYEN